MALSLPSAPEPSIVPLALDHSPYCESLTMSGDAPLGSEFTTVKGYEYRSNQNLVLQSADRRSRFSKEPTGEAESLRGKLSYPMGDRAGSSKPAAKDDKVAKKKKKPVESGEGAARSAKRSKTGSVLDQDGTIYFPGLEGLVSLTPFSSLLSASSKCPSSSPCLASLWLWVI